MPETVKVDVFDVPAASTCSSSSCGCGPAWSSQEIVTIVDDELQRRFPDQVVVEYHDARDPQTLTEHSALVEEIQAKGLLYPVTVIDGVPIYDGAVSYPAIIRAVGNKIADRATAQS